MNPLKWITLPPIVAIATVSLVRSLASVSAAAAVDPALWMLTALLFLVVTAFYGLFIIHNFNLGLLPLQLVAQGVLMCPLALSLGARMFSWVGVTMAVCGAVVLAALYHRAQELSLEAPAPAPAVPAPNAALLIPVAFAITDETGTIINVSNAMLAAAALSRDKVLGQSITVLLTPGEDTAEIEGRTWRVTQVPMDDDCYYFQIDEQTESSEAAPEPDASPAASDGGGLIDPVTRLQPFRYAMSRLDEELYRVGRFGHPLSVTLLRLAFPEDAEADGSAQEAFNAYCALLRENLRISDTAACSGGRDVLVALPECIGDPASAVIDKLLGLVGSLCGPHPVFYNVTTLQVSLSLTATDDLPDARSLLVRLNDAMARKYALGS